MRDDDAEAALAATLPVPTHDSESRTLDAPESGPQEVDPSGSLEGGDRYELRSILGVGGMGEVRLCKDARIGREVALKVMRRPGGDASTMRFVREARVQGQLEHPAIVPVYDLGAKDDGSVWFSMKRVRGVTLEEVIARLAAGDEAARARHTQRRLLGAFATVCLAVHFAHTRGVVHRDIKPSNVMLGDFGEVYLLDWGIAKIASSPDALSSNDSPVVSGEGDAHLAATAFGTVLGTPGYMSPEQALGAADVDARVDVYALGCVLFEILALKPCHTGSSVPELVASTLDRTEPARPARAAPERSIAIELDEACARATAPRAADRTATARELAEAIERYLDGERDVARRQELASEHVRAALAAAQAAKAEGARGQKPLARAMNELGRALALVPDHAGALAALEEMIAWTPDETPPEVQRQLDALFAADRRAALLGRARGHVGMAVLPLLAAVAGVRSGLWVAATVALLLFAAAIARAEAKARVPKLGIVAVALPGILGLATMSAFFGPFVVVPTSAAIATTLTVLFSSAKDRRWFILLGFLPFLGPWLLEIAGVVPRSYAVIDGNFLLLPRAVEFTSGITPLALLVSCAVGVLAPSLQTARLRESLTETQRKLLVQAWQFRQMLPGVARELAGRQE